MRTDLLSLLIFGLVFMGMAALVAGPLALAAALVIFLASGLVFGPRELHLDAERTFSSERVLPGEEVVVTVRVTNQGGRLEEVSFTDRLPGGLELTGGSPALLCSIEPGAQLTLSYTVRGGRGLYSFPGLAVNASDLLHINQTHLTGLAPRVLAVLPQPLRIKQVAIRPRQTRLSSGVIPARQGGSGIDFLGVRQYSPGDALRRINWKVSARRSDSLFSNEFEQERAADVGLILDARRRLEVTDGGEGVSLFEHKVLAAATLAETLLKAGNRVGLLVYGGYLDWTFPGYGKIQQERILRALASARTGESQAFNQLRNLPARFFPRHSQLILISSLHPDDFPYLVGLRAVGYALTVISPDPVAFEAHQMAKNRADLSWAAYPFYRQPGILQQVWAAATGQPARKSLLLYGKTSGSKQTLSRQASLGLRLAQLERAWLLNRLGEAGIQALSWDTSQPFDQAMQAALSRAHTRMHIRGVVG